MNDLLIPCHRAICSAKDRVFTVLALCKLHTYIFHANFGIVGYSRCLGLRYTLGVVNLFVQIELLQNILLRHLKQRADTIVPSYS